MQQLSAETYRLAHTHHLGTPLAVYWASVSRSTLLYNLIGAGLVTGLLVEGILAHQWVVLLPALLISILVWALVESTSWVRNLRIVVCTEGLVRVHDNEESSIHWDEIGELWRDQQGNYAFSHADGTRFIINHVFRHLDELVATIEEEVTRRVLPQVLAMYQHGETIRFGQVQVNRQGISTEGNMLPWSGVGDIQMQGGLLVIKRQGTALNSLYVSIKSTPNLCVLEALIASILEGEPL